MYFVLCCVYTFVNREGWVGTHEEGTFRQPQHNASLVRKCVDTLLCRNIAF